MHPVNCQGKSAHLYVFPEQCSCCCCGSYLWRLSIALNEASLGKNTHMSLRAFSHLHRNAPLHVQSNTVCKHKPTNCPSRFKQRLVSIIGCFLLAADRDGTEAKQPFA